MNRHRYSTLVKAIFFGIQMIVTVSLAASVVLLNSCIDRHILNLGDLKNESFVDSGYYERQFQKQAENIITYLSLRPLYETDGVYDSEKGEADGVSEESVNTYKKYLNKYDNTDSNMYYWMGSVDGGCLYTNFEENMNLEEAWTAAAGMGSYIYYDSSNFTFETNVGGMEQNYYNQMVLFQNLPEKNCVLIISADTAFPYADDLSVAKKEFDKLYPWTRGSLRLVVVSVIAWLLCFCYLTVTAGKRAEDAEIHLNRFDHLKTEIAIVFLLGGVGLIGAAGYHVAMQEMGTGTKMVSAAILALVGVAFFMTFYLSLVRRVKGETFWDNSITMWAVKILTDMKDGEKAVRRVFLLMTIKAVIWLAFAILGFGFGHIWAVALLLVCLVWEILLSVKEASARKKVFEGIRRITQGELDYKIPEENLTGDNKQLASSVNHIGDGLSEAIGNSVRDERMKANLITNVSHDIKTPLTSIINYIGLLKMEDIQNENARNYIEVLDQKTQRLKQLTEDLVEASRITSGNVTLSMEEIDFVELVRQTGGEFNERLEDRGLNIITKLPKGPLHIMADGRQLWRVIGNLYSNVIKYALSDTRVYVALEEKEGWAVFSMKNISAEQVSVPSTDLTERFIRGDVSRTTEGSGLGLSIVKSLTELMNGRFSIELDGDLFKAEVAFLVTP